MSLKAWIARSWRRWWVPAAEYRALLQQLEAERADAAGAVDMTIELHRELTRARTQVSSLEYRLDRIDALCRMGPPLKVTPAMAAEAMGEAMTELKETYDQDQRQSLERA